MHVRTFAAAATALAALALPAAASAATLDGAADTTFGDTGFAFSVPDGLEHPQWGQIIQQADGKIVGTDAAFTSSHVQIVRFTTAGQPDAGFGTDGVADIDLPQGQHGTPVAIREMSDHTLVVAGPLVDNTPPSLAQETPVGKNRFFLLHLNTDGTQLGDIAIGQAPTDCTSLRLLRVRSDGGVVAITGDCPDPARGFGAYGFLPDATADPGYAGAIHHGELQGTDPVDATLGPDGTVYVLSGVTVAPTITTDVAAVDAHGADVGSFGTSGHTTFPGLPAAIALDGAGRPVVAGGDEDDSTNTIEWRATRLTAGGALDGAFGTGGRATVPATAFGTPIGETFAEDVAVDTDGRVYLAAAAHDAPIVVRLTNAGKLDPGFGSDATPGVARYDGDTFTLNDMLVQADGKPVLGMLSDNFSEGLAGQSSAIVPRRESLALLRITATPIPPIVTPTPTPTNPAPTPVVATSTPPKVNVARSCLSRRNFSIRLKPRGKRIVKATVKLGGKVIAVRRGHRLRSTIDLRNAPVGTFTVTIDTVTADGQKTHDVRTYHTCRVGPDVSRPVQGGSHVTVTVG